MLTAATTLGGVMDAMHKLSGTAKFRARTLMAFARDWPRQKERIIRARRQIEAAPILERIAGQLSAFAADVDRATNVSPTYGTEAQVFMDLTRQIEMAADALHNAHVGDDGKDAIGKEAIGVIRAGARISRPSAALLTFPPIGPEPPPGFDPEGRHDVPWGILMLIGGGVGIAAAIVLLRRAR